MRLLHACLFGTLSLALAAPASAQSASFVNTVDGYVEAAYDASVVPRSGLTVEAWVTYDETTIGPSWRYPTIMRQNGNAGQESFFLRVESGDSQNTTIRFLVNTEDSGPQSASWSFGPGGLLNWTHLAGTYDGSSIKIYADGVEVATASATGMLKDNGGFLRIGKGSDVATPIEVWNGAIDEVRLWPFARTQAEILATKDVELWSVPGKVSTWNLDGNGNDSSGANPGTEFGSVTYGASAPGLTLQFFPGAAFGTGTAGCFGPMSVTVGSMPHAGSTIFSMVAHTANPGAAALAYVGQNSLGVPLNLLGVDVFVDPIGAIGLFTAPVGPLGDARLNLAIPASIPPGFQATVQFFSFDPCAPAGLSASDAMGILTLP